MAPNYRAERLIYDAVENSSLEPLQHRRDVAGMAVMYKVHVLDVEHLRSLRLAPRPVPRITRAASADTTHRALKEPRCNTLHQQLQFLPRYAKLWNNFVTSEPHIMAALKNMQQFKSAVNKWLLENHRVP